MPRIPLLIYWICELKLFSPLSCLEKRLLAPGSLDRASHISSRYQHCPLPLTLTSTFYSSIELFFYLSVSSPPSQLQILSLFSHSTPLTSTFSFQTQSRLNSSSPKPPSTSDISRVTPPLPSQSGSALGSPSNQTSSSSAYLAHLAEQKQATLKQAEEERKSQPLRTRIWKKVKEEAAHYWHGSKLLGKEVRISARLVRRLMMGYGLTRRERRQVSKTISDEGRNWKKITVSGSESVT